jgi:hypothetical protein
LDDKRVILETVVGSTLHGIAVQDGLEDLDLMAIAIETQRQMCGFYQEDTWTHRTKPMGVRSEAGDVDYVCYGLRKFLSLATKGNPSILLALFAPDQFIRKIDEYGEQLRSLAPNIVSKQCFAPFRGYMRQQHERLINIRGGKHATRPELVERYGYDTKYAAHILRLGLQGVEILSTGRLTLPLPDEDRELLIKVRTGGFSLAEISIQITAIEEKLIAAFERSPLPEKPDMKAVQQWMLTTYLKCWI